MTDEEKSELCMRCGNCCKKILFHIVAPDLPDVAMEWFNARGVEIMKKSGRRWVISLSHTCPNLVEEGKGEEYRCYCRIYDHRPKACRNYDGRFGEDRVNCKWRGGEK